jgi:hypothetical protein
MWLDSVDFRSGVGVHPDSSRARTEAPECYEEHIDHSIWSR